MNLPVDAGMHPTKIGICKCVRMEIRYDGENRRSAMGKQGRCAEKESSGTSLCY